MAQLASKSFLPSAIDCGLFGSTAAEAPDEAVKSV